MKVFLGLFAPYLAVLVFWVGFSNAWLAMLAYHAQILLFTRGRLPMPKLPAVRSSLLWALPALLAGPLVYLLLPVLAGDTLSTWLLDHRVTAPMLLVLLPYFGLVHPWLEQAHWNPLRQRTWLAHPLFAGYHVIVLWTLTTGPWLAVSFFTLSGVSMFWSWITRRSQSLVPAYLSHALADSVILIAAFLRA